MVMRGVVLKRIATVLFVAAVPLFLITTNVRWAANELRLYSYGFDKYNITAVTGIQKDELMRAARQIRSYFYNDEEFLDVRVRLGGEERSIYKQREVLHMKDVKGLVQGVYRVQEGSGAYLLAYIVVGLLLWRRVFGGHLARRVFWGSLLVFGLVLLVGLFSVGGFSGLFRAFHLVSFSNSLWQLDPYNDFLLMMFPQGFFFDATMFIAIATVFEALVVGGVSWAYLRWRRAEEAGGAVTGSFNISP